MSYQKLHEILKKKIRKDYGPKCPEYCSACCVCDAYITLAQVREFYLTEKQHQAVKAR